MVLKRSCFYKLHMSVLVSIYWCSPVWDRNMVAYTSNPDIRRVSGYFRCFTTKYIKRKLKRQGLYESRNYELN